MKEGYTIVCQKIDWERYLGTQWVFKELRTVVQIHTKGFNEATVPIMTA